MQIQKHTGNQYTNAFADDAEKAKGKGEIISEMGISTQVLLRATSKEQKPKLRLQIQTAQGRRTDLQTSVTNSTEVKTKSEITEEAARKIGELLLQIQKQSGARTDLRTSSSNHEEVKTKSEITSEMGMTKDQVSQYQQMAQNHEAVQAAIQKAKKRSPQSIKL